MDRFKNEFGLTNDGEGYQEQSFSMAYTSSQEGIYLPSRDPTGLRDFQIKFNLLLHLARIPTGSRVIFLVLGLDGWFSNYDGIPEFVKLFGHLKKMLVLDCREYMAHLPHLKLGSNGRMYGAYDMDDITQAIQGSEPSICTDLLHAWRRVGEAKDMYQAGSATLRELATVRRNT